MASPRKKLLILAESQMNEARLKSVLYLLITYMKKPFRISTIFAHLLNF
ncbi:hypothetical protein ABIE66_001828 [Peribacillus sp. B2I2]